MVVVPAVAFGASALALYYGARALRTKRAIRRLERTKALAERDRWQESGDDGKTPARVATTDEPAFERGFGLLFVGLLCGLFGVLAL